MKARLKRRHTRGLEVGVELARHDPLNIIIIITMKVVDYATVWCRPTVSHTWNRVQEERLVMHGEAGRACIHCNRPLVTYLVLFMLYPWPGLLMTWKPVQLVGYELACCYPSINLTPYELWNFLSVAFDLLNYNFGRMTRSMCWT